MWFRCLGIILSPVWPQWRGSISLLSGPRVRSRVLTPHHHLCRNISVYWYKNNCFHFNLTVQAYTFISVSWEPFTQWKRTFYWSRYLLILITKVVHLSIGQDKSVPKICNCAALSLHCRVRRLPPFLPLLILVLPPDISQ